MNYAECACCDTLAFGTEACTTCKEDGDTSSVYCSSCSAACPSCGQTFCDEHANSRTKWCRLCTQRENGPRDYITEDRWPALSAGRMEDPNV